MWVFKTTAASMKGSQVGNRSAGRIGSPSGARGPNGGERIYRRLHFSCVLYGFSRGTGTQQRGTDLQNIGFSYGLIRFSAGNGDLIYRIQISRYNSSKDILPTSVAMWVFKTADASMKGSQVGNRSAGQLGDTASYGGLTRGTDLQNIAF